MGNRMYRCCFIGHNSEKIFESETTLRKKIEKEIKCSLHEGMYVFISGMTRGFDIIAAEEVLRLREEYKDIKLICAFPFVGYEERWSLKWRARCEDVKDNSDLIRYISGDYNSNSFRLRNKWMIDHSARLIAYYNGGRGEIANAVGYAGARGVRVLNLFKMTV